MRECKNLQYVQGAFDTARLSKIQFAEPVIQRGDLLGITLFSDDAAATAAVMAQPLNVNVGVANTTNSSGNSSTSTNAPASSTSAGFLVDQQGNIRLYKLGTIHAEGKTKRQLADSMAALYVQKNLLLNPHVEIQFLNYRVTLIGEVTKPGTYIIPTDKISIFEALGLAGDITVFGKRNNVLVVREKNGVLEFGQLDLSKPEVFTSSYFYLQQNDMVIVDVAKK
ncbi:polysaccharide biosynthesis/export family protein [Paraflavitalea speifideaquila]|uniref:polysaccharide biosynthesis/export family protein n=1 Tax=Paraflavitalea speifideaquila TaxID=3076558 RepID=UPI0028E88314|nr:polysaccharide biosynthesis/export family protein [Paraflavitalea speifideiaquila]